MTAAGKKSYLLTTRRGYTLLASILVALFLGIFLTLSFMWASSHVQQNQASQSVQDALYAAESGLQDTLAQVRANLQYNGTVAPVAVVHNGQTYGYYTVQIVSRVPNGSWTDITTVITGQDYSQTAKKILDVIIHAQLPTKNVVDSPDRDTIDPGVTIDGSILALDVDIGNATPDKPIVINGDVTYLRDIFYDPNNPNIMINGDIIESGPVTFIGIDKDRYYGDAQSGGYLHPGDLYIDGDTLTRSYEFAGPGTNAANGVVYVQGDVYISATTAESMVIVAEGDIYITGDVTYPNPVPDPENPIQLGLFAKGDIVVQDPNPTAQDTRILQAFLIAEGEFRAEGDDTDNDELLFFGAMSIRGDYDPATSAISVSSSFAQRTYMWHSALFTNSTIPSMGAIADVTQWSIRGDPVKVVR